MYNGNLKHPTQSEIAQMWGQIAHTDVEKLISYITPYLHHRKMVAEKYEQVRKFPNAELTPYKEMLEWSNNEIIKLLNILPKEAL
jgi:hypothetical protein